MEGNDVLKKGFELRGKANRYVIEGVLGQGAFGITYIAKGWLKITGTLGDDIVQAPVAVKEFFISNMNMEREATGAVRQLSKGGMAWKYAERFKTEALNLAKLSHDNIVRVIDFIETNGTYYYVMRLVEGDSLDDYIKTKGPLSETEALGYIKATGDALMYMHAAKVLHLDLKPKNIMRRKDGHIYLIDFGLSKQFTENGQPENATSIGLGTNGYAPLEQSSGKNSNEFQATLDVYALGATLFKLLTGKTPPEAADIMNDGLPKDQLIKAGVSEKIQQAIEHAMQPRRSERTQTVEEFLKELGIFNEADASAATHTEVDDDEGETIVKMTDDDDDDRSNTTPQKSDNEKKPSRKLLIGIVAAVVVVLGVVAIVALNSGNDDKYNYDEATLALLEEEEAGDSTTTQTKTTSLTPEVKKLSGGETTDEASHNEEGTTTTNIVTDEDAPASEAGDASASNDKLMAEIGQLHQSLADQTVNNENEGQFYNYLMKVKQALAKGEQVDGYRGAAQKLSAFYTNTINTLKDLGEFAPTEEIQRMEQRKQDISSLR